MTTEAAQVQTCSEVLDRLPRHVQGYIEIKTEEGVEFRAITADRSECTDPIIAVCVGIRVGPDGDVARGLWRSWAIAADEKGDLCLIMESDLLRALKKASNKRHPMRLNMQGYSIRMMTHFMPAKADNPAAP